MTSAIAVPAYAGIPITHRDNTSSLSIITGHEDPYKNESSIDWSSLSKSKSIIFAKGSKVRWKTSALETSTYGLSHDVHPGKKFKIPIKEKASDCKAKVFLP